MQRTNKIRWRYIIKLIKHVEDKKLLSYGRFIAIAEQLGIALWMMAHGVSYRVTADKF